MDTLREKFLRDDVTYLPRDLNKKLKDGKINYKDYSDIEYNLNIYNALRIKMLGYRKQIINILKDN